MVLRITPFSESGVYGEWIYMIIHDELLQAKSYLVLIVNTPDLPCLALCSHHGREEEAQ